MDNHSAERPRSSVLSGQYAHACAAALVTLAVILAGIAADAQFSIKTPIAVADALSASRTLYAVNQSSAIRGSISVYDIDRGHALVKIIPTVSDVNDIRGAAVSAATGKLYVAYRNRSGVGMIYCLSVHRDAVLWNRAIDPDVDRLSIHPDGRLLYVPTSETGSADYINVLDADSGDIVHKVYFSNRSHDTLFPLSGPLFQETKATDGSGHYLYLIDPNSYAVSRIGPYSGILGPYAVDGMSRYVVSNVSGLWGMQVADIKTGQIISASVADHPPGEPGLLHGIGWTPDESEVWESSSRSDPHIYIWSMLDPMAPKFKEQLSLRSPQGSQWLTFDLKGDYAYVTPNINSGDGTEIFNARTRRPVGLIGSSKAMIEIDFMDGKISRAGDQYGIGRAVRY
jgi:6-phosphogluconolactonase (cycloisomerase 2 family)